MEQHAIISQMVDEVSAATPGAVDVRTDGGDQDTDIPEVIIRWSATRLQNENGHNSVGGYIYDNNDNQIGIQHHVYYRMNIEFILRWYDEIERDQTADDIIGALLPYETDADKFNADTTEWELGDVSPRNNAVMEPDWYESSLNVSFKYVKRVDDTEYDTIDDITIVEYADDTLDTTETETS